MGHPEALAWLHANRSPEGAWPYRQGGPPQAEPTLLAAAAGAELPLAWLQTADLGWGELLLPAALHDRAAARARCDQALGVLLERKGQLVAEPVGNIDGSIEGWSWVEGTASWVQPTAWAVLSLQRSGRDQHPRALDGVRLLVDRQGSDGGWNYGNPRVLGQELPSYLYLTGWVLLALPPGTPGVDRAFAFLAGVLEHASTTNLACALLAHLAHSCDPSDVHARLLERQQADGSFGEAIERTAIAAAALGALETGSSPLLGPFPAPSMCPVP